MRGRLVPLALYMAAIGFSVPAQQPSSSASPQLPACPAKFNDSLETTRIAGTFGNGISAPKATKQPEAEFSNEARQALKKAHIERFEASSLIGLLVDVKGMPQDLCLKKAAGYGLDTQAEKAVRKYRFIPAIKDGKPVQARLIIEVNFKRW